MIFLGVVLLRAIFANVSHTLVLSPAGYLIVEPDDQAEPKLNPAAAARLTKAFAASGADGLELLASVCLHEPLTPTFSFWRGWRAAFLQRFAIIRTWTASLT